VTTPLSCEVREEPGSARLILHGEPDADSAAAADKALLGLLGRGLDRVIVDLTELDFMDSTGIKFLLDGRDAAGRLGVEIAIAHGGDPIERILTVAGVTTLFERQD
jgi:anti-sigma B factor antagonist